MVTSPDVGGSSGRPAGAGNTDTAGGGAGKASPGLTVLAEGVARKLKSGAAGGIGVVSFSGATGFGAGGNSGVSGFGAGPRSGSAGFGAGGSSGVVGLGIAGSSGVVGFGMAGSSGITGLGDAETSAAIGGSTGSAVLGLVGFGSSPIGGSAGGFAVSAPAPAPKAGKAGSDGAGKRTGGGGSADGGGATSSGLAGVPSGGSTIGIAPLAGKIGGSAPESARGSLSGGKGGRAIPSAGLAFVTRYRPNPPAPISRPPAMTPSSETFPRGGAACPVMEEISVPWRRQ